MENKTKQITTYAFIDASNIIYGAKAEGWFIDQKKLLFYLRKKFSVLKAFFYYGKDSKNDKQENGSDNGEKAASVFLPGHAPAKIEQCLNNKFEQ